MTFETRITGFSRRFLSDRTFELIVSPALADFHYTAACAGRRTADYVAVLRAVAGGLRVDFARESGTFLTLALLPACYFAFLIVLCADLLELSGGFLVAGVLGVVLSLGPVTACYWPGRQRVPPAD